MQKGEWGGASPPFFYAGQFLRGSTVPSMYPISDDVLAAEPRRSACSAVGLCESSFLVDAFAFDLAVDFLKRAIVVIESYSILIVN